jgi:hypothetical protein
MVKLEKSILVPLPHVSLPCATSFRIGVFLFSQTFLSDDVSVTYDFRLGGVMFPALCWDCNLISTVQVSFYIHLLNRDTPNHIDLIPEQMC